MTYTSTYVEYGNGLGEWVQCEIAKKDGLDYAQHMQNARQETINQIGEIAKRYGTYISHMSPISVFEADGEHEEIASVSVAEWCQNRL